MDPLLGDLARLSETTSTLEDLARGLLTVLGEASGFESVYLVRLAGDARDTAVVAYVRNTTPEILEIPEGLVIPWRETMCYRAHSENVPFTHAANERWTASVQAAADMPITSYLVVPVEDLDGSLSGVLCAASNRRLSVSPEVLSLYRLCARLMSHQLGRDAARGASAPALARARTTDPVTGLSDRRTLRDDLAIALRDAARDGSLVCVAFIAVGGLDALRESHGAAVADTFLAELARRLAVTAEAGVDAGASADGQGLGLVARFGDDEFVAVARIPRAVGAPGVTRLYEGLMAALNATYTVEGKELRCADAVLTTVLAQPGDTSVTLLQRADNETYDVTQARATRAQRADLLGA